MVKRAYRWVWTARIKRETLAALQGLALGLGYVVDVRGGHYGDPSPAAMLDALAAAYTADPIAVRRVLKSLLAANGVLPAPDPTE